MVSAFPTVAGGHHKIVCQHGAVVSQCRCPAPNKRVIVSETCLPNCLEQFTVDEESSS